MTFPILVVLPFLVALASALASFAVLRAIRRNPPPRQGRSRKKAADLVPQGGGLAVVPVLSAAWLICTMLGVAPSGAGIAALAIAGLAALSLQDMRIGLPPLYRYTAQAIAVVVGLIFLPGSGHVFHGLLPVTLDLIVSTVIWMGAMRAIPWSDREEGLTAFWLIATGIGAAAVTFLAGDRDSGVLALGIAAAAVAIGYLPWAWPPSRLLLGPVGTIPLGSALAWLVLSLAGRGHWAAALILASQPLGRLIWAGRASLIARRASQQPPAVRPPRSKQKPETPVARLTAIALAEGGLIGLACLSTVWPWPALVGAVLVVVRLTRSLAGLSGLGFLGI